MPIHEDIANVTTSLKSGRALTPTPFLAHSPSFHRNQQSAGTPLSASEGKLLSSLDAIGKLQRAFASLEKEYLASLALAESESDPDMQALAEEESEELLGKMDESVDELRRALIEEHQQLARLARDLITQASSTGSDTNAPAAATNSWDAAPSTSPTQPQSVIMEFRPASAGRSLRCSSARRCGCTSALRRTSGGKWRS